MKKLNLIFIGVMAIVIAVVICWSVLIFNKLDTIVIKQTITIEELQERIQKQDKAINDIRKYFTGENLYEEKSNPTIKKL